MRSTLPDSIPVARELLLKLSEDFPVYMARGNIECRMKTFSRRLPESDTDYEEELVKGGIKILSQ